jgi:anti-sigma B factor antagonist
MREEDQHVSNENLEQQREDDPLAPAGRAVDATRTELSIDVRAAGDRTVLSVRGELDLYSSPSLRDRVLAAADEGDRRLVIDLSAVPFMDSSGLGVIVGCLKRVRESGGDLALVTMPGSPPSKLLSLTGLDRAIPTFATPDEAFR